MGMRERNRTVEAHALEFRFPRSCESRESELEISGLPDKKTMMGSTDIRDEARLASVDCSRHRNAKNANSWGFEKFSDCLEILQKLISHRKNVINRAGKGG